MGTALLIPWRPGDPHREAAWSLLKPRHLQAGRTVIEGGCEGEWCKAGAVADALRQTDADVVVMHDADVWCDGLGEAIGSIDRECRWAIPHDKVYRLAEGQLEPTTDRKRLTQHPYPGWAGGGIVVIRRDAYRDCPLDPRFVGWGSEDAAWALALTTLFGAPWRGDADLWHWWHPPQPRLNRAVGSRESEALLRRYKHADGNRREMQALIEEAKSWQSTSSSTAPVFASS